MEFAHQYERFIGWIVSLCPAPDKFAHTYAGLGLWLASAILLNTPLRSPVNLAVIILLEIGNECIDRVAHGSWMWHDTIGDAAATWFWPAVLTIALHRSRRLRS